MEARRFDERPALVFWETTRACRLACRHCRAEAMTRALPDQLSPAESLDLIEQVSEFGRPAPVLVLTGGDPLMRGDVWTLVEQSRKSGIRVGIAPAVSDTLDEEVIQRIEESGVASVSISLDSASAHIHDGLRGVHGTFEKTLDVLRSIRDRKVRLQVNTVVTRETVDSLPDLAGLLVSLRVPVWEVFFLVETGRASSELRLSPEEWEDISFFLYQASKYGLTVRTVEGPMFRRAAIVGKAIENAGFDLQPTLGLGKTFRRLTDRLSDVMAVPEGVARAQVGRTRDGNGVVFVSHNGSVFPSGFLAHTAGCVLSRRLPDIYKNSNELRRIRSAEFSGKCGICEFKKVCGGSRARAYTKSGDILGADPACPYVPGAYDELMGELGCDNVEALIRSGMQGGQDLLPAPEP